MSTGNKEAGDAFNAVVRDDEWLRVRAKGTVSLTPNGKPYLLREVLHKQYGRVELTLTGPRGASYQLIEVSTDPGYYRCYSNGSGNALRLRGNEVLFIILGDIVEVSDERRMVRSRESGGWFKRNRSV